MPRSALTGTRIRERRALLGLKQAELARSVEISASYLNLIEHNRRRIAGKLLSEIARVLQVDVAALTQGAEAELLDQLAQAAAGLAHTAAETDRIDEFVARLPGWADLVRAQHRRVLELQDRVEGLSDRLTHDPRLSSAMHEVLSKVTAIRSAASILVETEDIDEAWRRRFHRNLHGDSLALAESAQALVSFLDNDTQAPTQAGTPWEEVELFLEQHKFHFPTLETGQSGSEAPETLLASSSAAALSDEARGLAMNYLRRYQREAAAMPVGQVVQFLQAGKGDPVRLADELGVSLPLVFRRLASAPELPALDPVGLVLCDATGLIRLRKSTTGFLIPRSGSACPLWPLYEALGCPGRPVSRMLSHSSTTGVPVQACAVADPRWPFGSDGPPLVEGWMILMPEAGQAEQETQSVLRVGSACRVCILPECAARQDPSVLATGF